MIALAVIEHPDRPALLVSEGFDQSRQQRFHRLLGGGVHFQELGAEAVARELREELGVEIRVERLAGVLENIFTYEGRPGHEIALVFTACFEDRALYRRDRFAGIEEEPVDALWRPVGESGCSIPLYPPGVLELLRT